MHHFFIFSIIAVLFPGLFQAAVVSAGEFEDFRKEANQYQEDVKAEFDQYKKELEDGFLAYKNAYEEEFNRYRKSISQHWGEFVDSDKKRWVSYSESNNVRRIIDFESGEVSIDVLDGDKLSERALDALFKTQIHALLNVSEKEAFDSDQVASRVEQRMLKASRLMKTADLTDARLFDFKVPEFKIRYKAGFIKTLSDDVVSASKRKTQGQNKSIVNIRFKIPDARQKKAQRFVEFVLKSADKEQIPVPLVFAIMETESSFNPMARSHVPAFGLMQVVPRSAGKDASKYLFGKPKILSPSFLYKSDNNITIGSAYLHILYYRYLKRIENPVSRLYCAIAAYNTGTGNVARAIVGKSNVSLAAKKINQMTPKAVYNMLLKQLPYEETRRYLKKVALKMADYQHQGV